MARRPLLRDRRGAPALEFALVAPLMLTLLAGSYDITQLLIAMRQTTSTARQIVQIATQQSVQPDQTVSLSVQQGYQAQTAIYAMMPALRSGRDTSAFGVTLSAAVFTRTPAGCTPGPDCKIVANIAWSAPLPKGSQVRRPCGVVPQVAPGSPADTSSLPTAGMNALSSIVVADVSYVFTPLFTSVFSGPVTLRRTAFLPPRAGTTADYVQYDPANAKTNSAVCPGYL